jgi:murein DD-endopeptidase MepM/ murein hydrolase activator NlpD
MRRPERPRSTGLSGAFALRAIAWVAIASVSAVTTGPGPAEARASAVSARSGSADLDDSGWIWPAASFRLERPYEAPAHRYGTGHRGVDLRPIGSESVRAPADGTIAFAGLVAGRGVLTIDHGEGLVTTLEPIVSPLLSGETVRGGDLVGVVALGGHAAPGDLHFGVRLAGDYINPLLLLGGVPRAVLLPCC